MSNRRRRRTRSDAVSDPTPAEQEIREEANRSPIPDEEIDADVQARQEAADEIDAGASELEDEAPLVDNTPVPDSVPAVPDAFTDLDRDDPDEYAAEMAGVMASLETDPPFDPEIFERGPLAAGIRMLHALLTEAEAGYITAQVDELERAIDEQFTPPERQFLGTIAAESKTASGLPDVAGAYRALVRARVQAGT